MLNTIVRTLVLYILIVVVMRIMGKRQIGQLQPFELVVAIMISELAAVPMENNGIPFLNGVIPILTLLMGQVAFSYISLKNEKARAVICGRPSVLIEKGIIVEEELKRQLYNINDLLEQLRNKNVANIADVEFAILETNGQLSVILKSDRRPIMPDDLKILPPYEGLPLDLIVDGKIKWRNLHKSNLDIKWLEDELWKKQKCNVEDILLASLDSKGCLYVQKKG